MVPATLNVPRTTTVGSTLGRMWRKRMRGCEQPMTRAAWMNSRSLRLNTCARTTRAIPVQLTMPMTKNRLVRPRSSVKCRARNFQLFLAANRPGVSVQQQAAARPSVTSACMRINSGSIQLAEIAPAQRPTSVPEDDGREHGHDADGQKRCAHRRSSRLHTSRPSPSVPSGKRVRGDRAAYRRR